ncbi:MAG: extracellular solute-binding protein family 5 [Lacrimispora sp.]|jgi:oligopeptide transport system substrate-binding protein|nr:extracellular solute-binding protein family 5 [Lacrimispora sp.]
MKKRVLALGTAACLVIGALSGCSFTGGTSGTTAGESSQSAGASQSASDKTTAPAAGNQVLSVYANAEIKTLVQWAASDSQSSMVNNNAFEGLLRLDEKNEAQPALAKSYDISDDKLTYTFHLRDGLQWSDGTPLTASDFVFSWLKQMSADATNGYSFIMTDYIVNGAEYNEGKASANDVGVKAVDDKTFQVTIKAPTPYFARLTVLCQFFPLNEAYVTSKGDQYGLSADNMIYCGPYVVSSYDPAVGATLKKNDKYWDAANVKIENAQVRVMKDASAALNAYLANELSQVALDSSNVAAYQKDPEFKSESEFRTEYLQFSLSNPVMKNKNIRKAVSAAIDRDTLAKVILADGSSASNGLVAEGMYGDGSKTFRELNGNLCPFNAEEAKKYWEEGCKELGETPTLTLLVRDDSVTKAVATYIQSELNKNLGIDITIDTKTVQARNELMDNDNYMFASTAWGADYDDAMTYLDLWTNGTPYRGSYQNENYNKLVNDARVETDDAKRLNMLLQAEKLLVDEDAIIAPLYHRGSATLTKSNVKGLVNHPFGPDVEFKYAYFE